MAKGTKATGTARGTRRFAAIAISRAAALFFGVYSLANALARLRSANPSQDLWWIDLRFLPAWIGATIALISAVLLIAYALRPQVGLWRRRLTVVACALLAACALQNVTGFYRTWGAGGFSPGVSVPFSMVIATSFVLLAFGVGRLKPATKGRAVADIAMVMAAVLLAALFPLAQIAFFGTSDYRARADAAVIFGAKVTADGRLSTSLADRMRTGVELYTSGLVGTLVMSGGVGESGADEAAAMRAAALRSGVPAGAILLDRKGVDTDATVRNTTAMFRAKGIRRVLVVSQGYHLPRIKLAYRAAGWDVRTVPAPEGRTHITQTPAFIAREVPAFWVYWMRSLARDVLGR